MILKYISKGLAKQVTRELYYALLTSEETTNDVVLSSLAELYSNPTDKLARKTIDLISQKVVSGLFETKTDSTKDIALLQEKTASEIFSQKDTKSTNLIEKKIASEIFKTKTELLKELDKRFFIGESTKSDYYLNQIVYDDLQFFISAGKVPATNDPTWATLTTNTGEWGFSVNEYIDLQSNELGHGWKEGTSGEIHVHISIPDANGTGSDRFAQFTAYIAYVNASSVWTETDLTAEQNIPNGSSALENFYLDLGYVDFSGLEIETQVKIRIKRIAATGGTEYASDVFIHQVGCHLKYDTRGSREEGYK